MVRFWTPELYARRDRSVKSIKQRRPHPQPREIGATRGRTAASGPGPREFIPANHLYPVKRCHPNAAACPSGWVERIGRSRDAGRQCIL